jgi:hypothetical protein
MVDEPVILDGEHLDQIEAVLDALSDGYGISAPSKEKQAQYQEMYESMLEARP